MNVQGSDAETIEQLFDKCNFTFVISNPREVDNPIIYASEGFSKMTGYAPEDILGRNCRFLQGTGTSSQAIMEIRDAIREERQTSICILNYRKDGTPFWNAFTLAPMKCPDGNVVYYIGIQVDVTTLVGEGQINEEEIKKIAQQELSQAHALTEDVLQHGLLLLSQQSRSCAIHESVPSSLLSGLTGIAGSFVLSDPSLRDCPMVYCSPGFLKLTGYTCQELVGRNCRMLQGPKTDPKSVQKIRDGLASERPVTVSLLNYKKDGTPFQKCVHIVPIRDAAGKVMFFCGVQMELLAGRKSGRASAVADSAMLTPLSANGEGESNGAAAAAEGMGLVAPTPIQLLQQKGTVGAVKVAARALSKAGLRRAEPDQGPITLYEEQHEAGCSH